MANTSANITVTDGTQFALDMPVFFSASANGFTFQQTYFVTSIAANVITVSTRVQGPNVVATGSAAINIETYGFPCVEISGVGAGNSGIQGSQFLGLDLEGFATCRLLLQNATGVHVMCGYVTGGEGTDNVLTVAVRNAASNNAPGVVFGGLGAGTGMSYDIDANSLAFQNYGPTNSQNSPGGQTQVGLGLKVLTGGDSRLASQSGIINLWGKYGADFGLNKNQTMIEMNGAPLGFPSRQFASGASLGGGATNQMVYTGAGGGNATLSTIPANGDGLALHICNPSSGTLTLNTSSSQTVNGSGTSFVMLLHSSVWAISCYDGTNYFWSIG